MEFGNSDRAAFGIDTMPFYRRTLLLQGPVGPFFRRINQLLEQRGSHVTKVNFNSGDDWFYRSGDVIRYTGPLNRWPAFLKELLNGGNYDAVFLFGDCRPIHRPVREIAAAAGCAVWVFEEGYFRPSYITLERGGVNGYSQLLNLDMDRLAEEPIPHVPEPTLFPNSFRHMAWQAFTYFAIMTLGAWRYPQYTHHRPSGVFEALRWVRSAVRKAIYACAESSTIKRVLSEERKKRFFVFPLQVHNDAQICSHSDSPGINVTLRHVLKSFAQNASPEDWLVIKHHPMDRGHTNYGKIIKATTSEFGLDGRVHYVHDMHLPTLFEHCKGLVTVNSTAGLQGMHHHLPIITLGRSFYNKPDLTYQEGLDTFWTTRWRPNYDLYLRFRARTILSTQINSSFYADPRCGSRRQLAPDSRAESASGNLPFLVPIPSSGMGDGASLGTAVSLQSDPGAAIPET